MYTCPSCGGSSVSEASKAERRSLGWFQVLTPLRCDSCRFVWEPDAPRWVIALGLVFSLAVLLFAIWLVIMAVAMNNVRGITATVLAGAGGIATVGCFRRLRRR